LERLGLLESQGTFGKSGGFWKARGLLESPGTFGKSGDFWKAWGLLESGDKRLCILIKF